MTQWSPTIIGMQEPFNGQLMHLMRHAPSKYKAVGFKRKDCTHSYNDMGRPERKNDYQTAILYDSDKLELVHEDHVWLSKTPRVQNSKDWGSIGIRTVTMARLKVKEFINQTGTLHILAFNTHLDVWSELARRKQAEVLLDTISNYSRLYPKDIVFLTGDFNSIPGHQSYHILTSKLRDSWNDCKDNQEECISNDFASTYHHWLGTLVNTYGARIFQSLALILHGSGALVINKQNILTSTLYSLYHTTWSDLKLGLPAAWNRYHVDWILYQNSSNAFNSDDGNHSKFSILPRLVTVAEVRSTNFSSDHFPVVALFKLSHK